MTDIPGTGSIKKLNTQKELDNKIKLETVVNIRHIKKSKIKPTTLSFDNLQFRNWVILSSILVSISVILLCFYSIKFSLLIFSGPGVGVVSFYIKETSKKHLHGNDTFIKRYTH